MQKHRPTNIKRVKDDASFERMLRDLKGSVSFDLETSGLYPWAKKDLKSLPKKWKKKPPDPRSYDAKITSIGFGVEDIQWIWLPHEYEVTRAHLDRVQQRLERCVVIAQYGKFDLLWMKVIYGVDWNIDFDTGIAHYMIDENTLHGLKDIAQRFLNVPNWDVDAETKKGNASIAEQVQYHAYDLRYTRDLYPIFKKMLAEDPAVRKVFKKIMMPCVKIFVDAEYEGSYINLSRMGEVETELRRKIKVGEKGLEKWVPISKKGEFNWGSPKQVGWLLYKKLKIKCPAQTKTGADSTSESTLKQIEHPLVKDLFDLRGAKQQLSFFIEGWKPYLHGFRIHPSFKLTGTVTGRLSCEHPNWQQVPRDKFIRTLLIAPPGWCLVEADLSQIELRIAAELSGDSALIETFVKERDPHWVMAIGELQRGGGGSFKELTIETAKMYLMSFGLSPDGTSAKILQEVWQTAKSDPQSDAFLSACREDWADKATGSWKRGLEPKSLKQSLLARGFLRLAKEVSEESVRALRKYFERVSSSQGRKSKELEKIEFSDALQIVSQIGASTAADIKDEWKEIRKKAKAISFGYLYGMWWKKFKIYARDKYDVHLTDEQAQESRKSFFNTWRDLEDWHKRAKRFARRNGYVRYLSGRKRRLPGAQLEGESFEKGEAERQAVNSPVQGFANEINLMALIQLRKEFPHSIYRPIATVHDSILAYVRVEHVEKVCKRTLEIMRRPELMDEFEIRMKVPIEADIKIGPWGAGVSLKKYLGATNGQKSLRQKSRAA